QHRQRQRRFPCGLTCRRFASFLSQCGHWTHLRDADRKAERFRLIVEAGDVALSEGYTPVWEHVRMRLMEAGFEEGLSQSRIEHLRSDANQLPEYRNRPGYKDGKRVAT
ncbi:MAG: hypothetical protein U9N56_08640, partial [Actinomycetota bacterium]|nr:hypothetical protein [Actinomycetota bacterium]